MRFPFKLYSLNFLLATILLSVGCASPKPPQKQAIKIIAMGDMHGDYDVYESLMLSAGLMDSEGNWSGGDTIFVQTGDIPDRAPDTRKIIESLQHLEVQAPQSGGKVVPMVGNHEAMNMVGDLRYVHLGEFTAFADNNSELTRSEYYQSHITEIELEYREDEPNLSAEQIRRKWEESTPFGKIEHQVAWGPKGDIGAWVSGHKLVTKIDGYLFAHGGFSKEYTQYTLSDMNRSGTKALLEQDWKKTSILRDNLGPLWYRGNVRGREDDLSFSKEAEIEQVLEAYDATHIIIGHTRSEEGIRVSLDGRLFQIDTGASQAYGGVPSYLRIENGEFFSHTLEGVRPFIIADE